MTTIHFDARFIRLDYHDGISRFSVELINALAKDYKVVAIIHDLKQLVELPQGIEHLLVNSPESPKEFFIARKLNRAGAKLVFSPMQIMGSWGRNYKLVLTLHDLIYYRHRKPPNDLSLLVKLIWRVYHLSYIPQRILLNRADTVVTVSETTKRLIQKHRLTKRPVEVIYNAVTATESKPRKYPTTKDLVYVGSFMPYKNVETLILGAGKKPEYTLHLLSKITENREDALQKLADRVGAKVNFHGGVSDERYREILDQAFAAVSASRDEGFGIPLIEAMSRRLPVLVSDLEIFREVAGDSGTYFDSESAESMATAIELLEDKDYWNGKSEAAFKRSTSFSWDASASKLSQLFQKLDSERNNR